MGESGSGRTTLMNMLSGIYHPTQELFFVNGEETVINSPSDSAELKIGMIHQHFKLINVFSALDNIALGNDRAGSKAVAKRAKEICDSFGLDVDLR